jgi:Ca2+-binding EF-hand superfamily protein
VNLWSPAGREGLRSFTSWGYASACPEDVNGDGFVDVEDLLAVLAAWGQTGVPADVNTDGVVDVADLLLILAAWGTCP